MGALAAPAAAAAPDLSTATQNTATQNTTTGSVSAELTIGQSTIKGTKSPMSRARSRAAPTR